MAKDYTKVLLITANVGSIFEDVSRNLASRNLFCLGLVKHTVLVSIMPLCDKVEHLLIT